MSEPSPVDARFLRSQQGVVALVLLAGYVFDADWVIPLVALVIGLGIVEPRANVVAIAWDALVRGRLGPDAPLVDPAEARFSALLVAAVLTLATALLVVGLGGLAWLLAVVLAVTEAVGAVAAIPLGRVLRDWLARRRG